MIYEIAMFHLVPAKADDFLRIARNVIAQALKEPGCLFYDLASSITEPNQFLLVTRWASRDALDVHHATAIYEEWMRLASLYIADSQIEVIYPER